jgi:hypothetical protein
MEFGLPKNGWAILGRTGPHITYLLAHCRRKRGTNEHGQAPRCDDEMLLAMLDVNLGDLVSDGFDQGRRMGCDEERKRTRHFFHDVLSSKILVASFLAHEIYQKLTASGSEETEEMARLTKLLQEAIDAIVQGAEEY